MIYSCSGRSEDYGVHRNCKERRKRTGHERQKDIENFEAGKIERGFVGALIDCFFGRLAPGYQLDADCESFIRLIKPNPAGVIPM